MKKMRKSLMITTIAMVVLLVVSLSTATFAWYTAQSTVNVTQTQINAATSSSASIVIDSDVINNWDNNNTSVSIAMGQEIKPMVLNNKNIMTGNAFNETVKYSAFVEAFRTLNINASGILNGEVTTGNPSQIATNGIKRVGDSGDTGSSAIYVANAGSTEFALKARVIFDSNIYVPASVVVNETNVAGMYVLSASGEYTLIEDADAKAVADTTYYTKPASASNNFLRVAMFIGDSGTADADLVLANVWSAGYAKIHHHNFDDSPIVTTSTVASQITGVTTVSANEAQVDIININSRTCKKIKVVAWFDGTELTNAKAGSACKFKIDFEAGTINVSPAV